MRAFQVQRLPRGRDEAFTRSLLDTGARISEALDACVRSIYPVGRVFEAGGDGARHPRSRFATLDGRPGPGPDPTAKISQTTSFYKA